MFALCLASAAFAQLSVSGPLPLFFREEWKAPADVEHPVAQDSVAGTALELKLYGAGVGGMKPEHGIWIVKHNPPAIEPAHTWTGLCTASCAFALREKDNYMDLTGRAKVRFQYKVAGFHQLRPIVKLADGTWLAGDQSVGLSADWHEADITFADLRWRKLDMNKVIEAPDGKWIDHPDLTRVDEIGFTDLMAGSGHGPGGWSNVGRIEVYGKPVKRDSAVQSKLNQ
ncbi:MAG: hypothetical protein M3N93_13460 [Acidobacteriota bacterium]|nr:hypothetical protein [Acidobacteriota bacterium]